jgi:hypothetical protein
MGVDRPQPEAGRRCGQEIEEHAHLFADEAACEARGVRVLRPRGGRGPRAAAGARSPERLRDGIRLETPDGFLTVQVKTDSIVRVTFARDRAFRGDDMVVVGPAPAAIPRWTFSSSPREIVVSTARLRATIDRSDGRVTFADSSGRIVLAESAAGHRLTPAVVQGEETLQVQQTWQAQNDESLYGLGQRQEGALDIKGYDFDLWQRNTVVHVPFLVSSGGYGLLWGQHGARPGSAISGRSSRFRPPASSTCRRRPGAWAGRDSSSHR